ncbi:MAG: glycoside hydrolase family 3 C-terminal domain-containing protein [Bilifractor sp.]
MQDKNTEKKKIDDILRRMTLEDKIALCSGKDFWQTKDFEQYGIPSMFLSDGSNGLRRQDLEGGADMLGVNASRPATCFPSAVVTAQSWDPQVTESVGRAIGEEAVKQHVHVVLGPSENIKRNPLCGRNFEYFSEDPYLAGKLAAGYIRGLQSNGVSACLKHFAANSQEYSRFNSDSIMDERTLREIYLKGFEIAVKEGHPSSIMCAYPKLNGVHCSDSKRLLTDILRKEWGFDGMVVTDWGAMNDRIRGFQAGCDLNMPGGSAYMEKKCARAVREGKLSEQDIDKSARRILTLVFRTRDALHKNALQESCPLEKATQESISHEIPVREGASHKMTVQENPIQKNIKSALSVDAADEEKRHYQIAEQAAEQGAVLLRNRDGILPLAVEDHIAVIGHQAKEMRYQGAGSSHINAARVAQPMDFLKTEAYAEGYLRDGSTADDLIARACEIAMGKDKVLLFIGLPESYESEGFDRSDMKLPEGENRLVEAVAAVNPNTVVVLFSGSAVECPWADQVKAVLYMGLPGEAGGEAVYRLLYGKANPCGKLAETWPVFYEDCVSAPDFGKTKDAVYKEGIYVGYRYYDKAGVGVRWPFGFGESYTTFAYQDLKVQDRMVQFKVTNTGSVPGAEICELYIGEEDPKIHRPVRELKGFRKVFLEPGETKIVCMPLSGESFAIWNDGWVVPAGTYTISIGPDSRHLLLHQEVVAAAVSGEKQMLFTGETVHAPAWQKGGWYETCKGRPTMEDFRRMSGIYYKEEEEHRGSYTMDNTVMEMKKDSLVMKIMYKAVENTVAKGFGGKKDYGNPEFRMLMASSAGSPLRSMQISGGIKGGLMEGLLKMANGHFFRGLGTMITGK